MSRVDEAMRRAAKDAGPAGARIDACAAGPDTVALVDEPYPVEAAAEEPEAVAPRPAAPALVAEPSPDRSTSSATGSPEQLRDSYDPKVAEKLVIDSRMPHACREQYRRLAGILHDAQAARGLRVVMFASAVAGEGKTLTAANVALTLSASYRKRVLLVDGDLRRPALHSLFRLDTTNGLSDGLDPLYEAKLTVRQLSPTLAVLPAGRPTPDPMAALISDRMQRLIVEARETFDWVLIDTPPLMLLPDAHLLASMVDGTVLVVRAESTPHGLIQKATDAVGRSRVLGVLLNGTTVAPPGSYGYDDENYYGAPGA